MTQKTKNWLLKIIEGENGDAERAAQWMARNFRSIGGITFFRAQLKQAVKTIHRDQSANGSSRKLKR